MTVRTLTRADLREVVRVHRAAFTDSALTWLGAGAVHRYYDWQIAGPHLCVAVGVWQGEVLRGFCVGGVFRGAAKGFVRKNRIYLACQVLARPWLVVRPQVRRPLVKVIVNVFGFHHPAHASPLTPQVTRPGDRSFGILAIGVDPHGQRRGVGTALMAAMETAAREQEFSRMHLTVRTDNLAAMHFYERLGWRKRTVDGHWQGAMERRLQAPAT